MRFFFNLFNNLLQAMAILRLLLLVLSCIIVLSSTRLSYIERNQSCNASIGEIFNIINLSFKLFVDCMSNKDDYNSSVAVLMCIRKEYLLERYRNLKFECFRLDHQDIKYNDYGYTSCVMFD